MKSKITVPISYLLLWLCIQSSHADSFTVTGGYGKQPSAQQYNTSYGIDYEFFRHKRSERQYLSVGVSYTRLTTGDFFEDSIDIFSIYPQLTLYPVSPKWQSYFFFVRALGASYISQNRLGARNQQNNFSFQAQIGAGRRFKLNDQREIIASLSWKHFSNANLFSDNDGFDIPLVISLGWEF